MDNNTVFSNGKEAVDAFVSDLTKLSNDPEIVKILEGLQKLHASNSLTKKAIRNMLDDLREGTGNG